MNSKKLQSIRQAEKMAKELLSSIEEETQLIIGKANKESAQILEAAKLEAKHHEQKLLEQYQNQGQAEAQTILSGLDNQLKNIDQSIQANEKDAVDYLQQQMKVIYGNH